ncbi:MAG TPA: CTP synthase, partial [Methanomicrobiales archaeon]|nr:CTP synthase [Methanomicrobiales archaeon]
GKGLASASIGALLEARGLSVTLQKFDPYINIDPGTMNPFQHGEVFVTDDGAETDLDLGHYERFIDENLSQLSNVTTGRIYQAVIAKERRGDYLGGTVQIIPHITDEIKASIGRAAGKPVDHGTAEICLVEVGGTVGDIESMPFLEAVRQMRGELPARDIALIHVTLVPMDTMGDMKTKPTQHSVKALRELGLAPDIIVARGERPLGEGTKRKISAFCDVKQRAVISAATMPDIYQVPLELEREGLADVLTDYLGLERRDADTSWYTKAMRDYTDRVTVGLVSKYGIEDVYISIKEALKHAGRALATEVQIRWIDAEHYTARDLEEVDGVVVPGGFGSRGIEGKIRAITHARENRVPFLGLCFGFQLAVVEYARSMLGISDAASEEFGSGTFVVAILPEQKGIDQLGGTMHLGNYPVMLKPGTLAGRLYGKTEILERHRHRYEVNPEFIPRLEKAGLVFSGHNGVRMEVCELPGHPFFLATQFHPEFNSRPAHPSPPFVGFVTACRERHGGGPPRERSG